MAPLKKGCRWGMLLRVVLIEDQAEWPARPNAAPGRPIFKKIRGLVCNELHTDFRKLQSGPSKTRRNTGGQGRNRTVDTRIFNDRQRYC